MKPDKFLYNLHFGIPQLTPSDWEVDWDDAPLSYKLYRNLPTFPFTMEIPLTLEEWKIPSDTDFRTIGHFLFYSYGLAQVSQSSLGFPGMEEDLLQSFRRFVPSGGALYPSELYMYLKLEDIPAGVYHYDAAHHQLVLLREGNFDSYISDALGNRCDVSSCFAVMILSTMFWKNFFKYHNFSYRLQGLDAGVLLGQMLELAKKFGFASGVYFQFLDRAINHLLGLSEKEESTYAIIPLSVETTSWVTFKEKEKVLTAGELCKQVPEIHHTHYVRSRNIKEYPMLLKMNAASMYDSKDSFRSIKEKNRQLYPYKEYNLSTEEPFTYDMASVCQRRFSPEMDFVLGAVTESQLATLLRETMSSFAYRNDLDWAHDQEPRVSLYVCLNHVENVPPGAYEYDSLNHSLKQIQPGDFRLHLQYSMTIDNVNLQQIPLCFHIGGDRDHYVSSMGYRGYRIQQMEAGMLVQRLLLTANAIDFGGHPLLSYDVQSCDQLYRMDAQGKTSLIQLPIGPFRARPWLRGNLHS